MSDIDMAAIERAARAMAIADGLDPDARTSGGPNDFALQAVDFNGLAVGVYEETWRRYQRQANLLLAGLNGLARPK